MRPAHLSWDGQAGVDYYVIKVYSSTGVLLHTVSTTNTTYT